MINFADGDVRVSNLRVSPSGMVSWGAFIVDFNQIDKRLTISRVRETATA